MAGTGYTVRLRLFGPPDTFQNNSYTDLNSSRHKAQGRKAKGEVLAMAVRAKGAGLTSFREVPECRENGE